MSSGIPDGAWQAGAAVAAVVVCAQGSFAFARWMVQRRNGRNTVHPAGNGQAGLNLDHAQRLATLEAHYEVLTKGQQEIKKTVTCLDRKITQLLALQGCEIEDDE